MSAEKKRRWKLIFNIITLVALGLLIYAIRHQLAETFDNLHHINIAVLALIIPLEILNYDSYARMYRSLFAVIGSKIAYRDMFRVALEHNMINNAFPTGGLSGFSYFGIRLKSFGVTAGKATLVQTMRFIFLFTSFQLLLVVGLLFLAAAGKANNLTILASGSLATLLIVGTAGLAFIIGRETRIKNFFTAITRWLNRLIHILRPKHPETIKIDRVQETFKELHENYVILKNDITKLKEPFLAAMMANVTEILVIYVVYVAFGHWVNPGAIIIAYAVANFAGLISVLPGGVGIYEFLMTAILATAGIPPAVSLPVTVTYRVLNMTIQIVPGYYFYHKAMHGPIRDGRTSS